jgi:hypothetical protein
MLTRRAGRYDATSARQVKSAPFKGVIDHQSPQYGLRGVRLRGATE